MFRWFLSMLLLVVSLHAFAGAQKEEELSDSVASAMRHSIGDVNAPHLVFANQEEAPLWLAEMSSRLASRVPDKWMRERLLVAVQYEATRAGLDPQLVLGLINVESGFKKYALSSVGARGLMQVMPFWVRHIGSPDQDLFDLTTNLRYGCTILRYYLDIENGDLFRALGRYNGSLGSAKYPDAVIGAWQSRWTWQHPAMLMHAGI